jgi:hypothetical protein
VNTLLEPEGYCSAWSMFFTELCLKNPEISSKDIYKFVLKNPEITGNKSDYFKRIIRGYTYYINNKIAKHFSDIFDENLTTEKIKKRVDDITDRDKPNTIDTNRYYNKYKSLMKTEFEKKHIPDYHRGLVSKFRSLKSRLKSETSSSISSKKSVTPKKSLSKESVTPKKSASKDAEDSEETEDSEMTDSEIERLIKLVNDYELQQKIKESMLKKKPEMALLKSRIKDVLASRKSQTKKKRK